MAEAAAGGRPLRGHAVTHVGYELLARNRGAIRPECAVSECDGEEASMCVGSLGRYAACLQCQRKREAPRS